MSTLSGMPFREYSPAELAQALSDVGSHLEVVCVEVQTADGQVVATDVMRLALEVDYDSDRSGGYAWVKLTGRLDR